MRTVRFPAQGELGACSMDFPYSESGNYTIFSTPQGYVVAKGIGNVLTGISGEKKVLEITLSGKSGVVIGESIVADIVVTDASDEEVLRAAREKKKACLAAERYKIEVSGVNVGAQIIATDDRSKAMVTGAALSALAKLLSTSLPLEVQLLVDALPDMVDWKGETGFESRPLTDILAAGVAVQAHVQPLFSREKALWDHLDGITTATAGTLEAAVAQIESVGWNTEI